MKSSELYVKLDTIKLSLDSTSLFLATKTGSEDVDRIAQQVALSALNKLNSLLTEVYTNGVEKDEYDDEED